MGASTDTAKCKRCGDSGVDPEPVMTCCGASAWQCGGNHCMGATAQPQRCKDCIKATADRIARKIKKRLARMSA